MIVTYYLHTLLTAAHNNRAAVSWCPGPPRWRVENIDFFIIDVHVRYKGRALRNYSKYGTTAGSEVSCEIIARVARRTLILLLCMPDWQDACR